MRQGLPHWESSDLIWALEGLWEHSAFHCKFSSVRDCSELADGKTKESSRMRQKWEVTASAGLPQPPSNVLPKKGHRSLVMKQVHSAMPGASMGSCSFSVL